MHDNRTLIPPEFLALMIPTRSFKIIGWTFQVNKLGVYYATNTNGADYVTMDRTHAQVYSDHDVMECSRNNWNWGRKNKGKWRAVYA